MLVPAVANRFSFLYALGNTPAVDLTRHLPHGQDAAILSLGCGDVRNVLYTSYNQLGLPSRKLDITCCDIDDRVLARNILLFTLIIDGDGSVPKESLWDIYYHLFVNEASLEILHQQTKKLLRLLESPKEWETSVYGRSLKFCNQSTLQSIKQWWTKISQGAANAHTPTVRTEYSQCIAMAKDLRPSGTVATVFRSAAPSILAGAEDLPHAFDGFDQYWKDGTVTPKGSDENLPNPMFASLVSDNSVLHYGSDPLLGYHLATAFAPLPETSPLKPTDISGTWTSAAAAKTQFFEWVSAFRKTNSELLVVRFVVSDAFALCHTLQHAAGSGELTANWYRRQLDLKILDLDAESYGGEGKAPLLFDMIDTSNLSDHFGALNILVSTVPLLKPAPWATVCTDLLLSDGGSQQQVLTRVLKGHAPTLSLLLGISPIQVWTNSKSESHAHEVYLALLADSNDGPEKQLHTNLVWKRDDQVGSNPGGRCKLHIDAVPLARILFQTYLQMFEGESSAGASKLSRDTAYSHFHRGSFAALLKFIKQRVETDWSAMCRNLLDTIAQDRTVVLSTNYVQELGVQLHLLGVVQEPWLLNSVQNNQDIGLLKGWKDIPPAVAVTLLIPRSAVDRLYQGENQKRSSPQIIASLKSSPEASVGWHNLYGDVHIAFGKVKLITAGPDKEAGFEVEEDELRWSGSSPLVVSFMVPTATLQVEPEKALIGIYVSPTAQNLMLYGQTLGFGLRVFETQLTNESAVYVKRHMPCQAAHRIVSAGTLPSQSSTTGDQTKLLAEIPASESTIATVTGHIDITSEKGKKLLQDKATVDVRQRSPFAIEIAFGQNKLICPMRFPSPITLEGKRVRIARTSGYIEVIAPLALQPAAENLLDFICPVALDSNNVPVSLNMSHLNLDRLPVLDLEKKDQMTWLTSLTSLQFSPREHKLRSEETSADTTEDVRVNFKDSLFTMFMLTSGLQGGQTGLFAISHPERGGIHMLIVVSAMRLDCASGSAVLDAAVIPLTTSVIQSGTMTDFLLFLRELECCTIKVNDAELELWKKALPSMAERCRTWTHHSGCEYKKHGKIPVSLGFGEQVLCSCGNGRVPTDFVAFPDWDDAVQYATRIAISPLFPVPAVEEVVDLESIRGTGGFAKERCRTCGRTKAADQSALKKCMRCQKVRYCSAECQKKDWKKHRMECKEVKDE